MARTIAAVFPDRAMAEQAMETLRSAGFAPAFAADDRQADGTSFHRDEPGEYTLVVEPHAEEADLRDLLMHAGAISLQGQGTDGPGHTISPTTDEDQPISVLDGERLAPGGPAEQARAAAYSASDHRDKAGMKDGDDLELPREVRRTASRIEEVDAVRRDISRPL